MSLLRVLWSVISLLTVASCSGSGGGSSDAGSDESETMKVTIVYPADGATNIPVSNLVMTASINIRLEDAENYKSWNLMLIKDGKTFYGLKEYKASIKELRLSPFNILQSNSQYTFKVEADGAVGEATFTTEVANQGELPPVEGKTFEFRVKDITYPAELGSVFNSLLEDAPPVLMNIVKLNDLGEQAGNHMGEFLIAGAPGNPEDLPGQAVVPIEDGVDRKSTTAVSLEGRVEGTWLGGGPADLHIAMSGIPVVIREFYVTGLLSADGGQLSSVALNGVIDPKELDVGGEVDLSKICEDKPDNLLRKFCDESGRIRIAANVEATPNTNFPFTAFITVPVNFAKEVDTGAKIQIYFSQEVDQGQTTVKLFDSQAAEVSGQLTFSTKSASFTPTAALSAASAYRVELVATSQGGSTDTRHIDFTTK